MYDCAKKHNTFRVETVPCRDGDVIWRHYQARFSDRADIRSFAESYKIRSLYRLMNVNSDLNISPQKYNVSINITLKQNTLVG